MLKEKENMMMRDEFFAAMKNPAAMFWVLMSCSFVVGYRRFLRPCYVHIHPEDGVI
jgi:hypothetical protein